MSISQSDPQLNRAHEFYTSNEAPNIKSVHGSEKGLSISFEGDQPVQFYSWFWLKDHGVDDLSLDFTTLQRKVDTFDISPELACIDFLFKPNDQSIELSWNDGSKSIVTAYLLASVAGLTAAKHQLSPEKSRILWDKDNSLNELPRRAYSEIVSTDKGLLNWLQDIHIFGFCLVEGVPTDRKLVTNLAERLGQVQETIFGTMWDLSSELEEHGDTAYSTQYLEPHTDGTYYDNAPGLQMFSCLEFDGTGGESVQVDGFAIAAQIKRQDPLAYATLCETVVPSHYLEPGVHLHAERPPFRLNASGELIQLTFNNYDRAPFLISEEKSERFMHAYQLLHTQVNDQQNWLKIALRPGQTLIFDNWRNLHGRMGYSGKRVFYGCYHSRAVFESSLRVLQTKLS